MAKKSFAPRVTNFSISCDPSMLDWLDDYAIKNKTSRSRVVRKALVDFRAEHKADTNENGPKIDPQERCVSCGAQVIHNYGLAICMNDNKHCNIEALPGGGHRLKPGVE